MFDNLLQFCVEIFCIGTIYALRNIQIVHFCIGIADRYFVKNNGLPLLREADWT
jgi:hypothetical protein